MRNQNGASPKHVLQQNEFAGLGIRTVSQFRRHVDNVIDNPTSIRYYTNGRHVYVHEPTGTVVVKNGITGDSTAFQPDDWQSFIQNLPNRTVPYS